MSPKGSLLRGSIADAQFRLFACETTAIVQHIRDIHDLYPLPSILMGRLITAVALMSGELKAPHSEISIRIDADGPLKGGIVIANKEGMLKGYAFVPQLWLPENQDNFQVGKGLGKGTFTVIRQSGLKAPYQGRIELLDGEIGTDLAQYYHQSEQLPTAVNLGVLIDQGARIRAAGGILIQALPQADTDLSLQIEENMKNTPNVSDLMDMGLTIEDILNRFVLKNLSWQISKSTPIRFHCDCSKARFARGLLLLGKDELQGLREDISPVCHYCNKAYTFTKEEIENLIKSLD
ncbi:MAG: Hsp33 family molecular chaperone HslO [Candidatus Cloacimonetes bacterium]|nr:Hsp33 family molecular chaperone HslO [Candidatus Cloacimonadota bacterium]